ncbi:hypothetical protein ABZ807_19595 [Micromonospora sp. NPDC047548]|uniref:hypothetical protein n=1 Tax=Micromonospora sp. NPDC047548 TaxID=3155624 RepID=UPI0033EC3AC6
MTDPQDQLHRMLLRLAGRLPDEVVADCRSWLADGLCAEVAQAVSYAAIVHDLILREPDAALLTQVLVDAGEDVDALALATAREPRAPAYGAAPVGPDVLAQHGGTIPFTLDLTRPADGPARDYAETDPLDRTAVAAVAAAPGRPQALWRCWRYPPPGSTPAEPRRLYLILADTALVQVTEHVRRALADGGESSPQVEVFDDPDGGLPAYHRNSLECAALLWTASAASPPRMAPLPDDIVGAHRAASAGDGARLDEPERSAVLAYLDAGVPLLIAHHTTDDVLDPRQAQVPVAYRTDGEWIWGDAAAYYLKRYGLIPHGELLDTIRRREYELPAVDFVAVHRALSALYRRDVD